MKARQASDDWSRRGGFDVRGRGAKTPGGQGGGESLARVPSGGLGEFCWRWLAFGGCGRCSLNPAEGRVM